MKLSKNEIIKKLAEAIIETHTVDNAEEGEYCPYCLKKHSYNCDKYPHKPDCPVLLAEEVLKDKVCPNCEGRGDIEIDTWGNPAVKCNQCNGMGAITIIDVPNIIKTECGCINGHCTKEEEKAISKMIKDNSVIVKEDVITTADMTKAADSLLNDMLYSSNKLNVKESILNLYRTVKEKPDATYEDVIEEFMKEYTEGEIK